MHTEEEAKKKWCPQVRDMQDNCAGNRGAISQTDTGSGEGKYAYNRCIASECMMWQVTNETKRVKLPEPCPEPGCAGKDGGCPECDYEGIIGFYEYKGYCGLARGNHDRTS